MLFPNNCIFCGRLLDDGCVVCSRCISEIDMITGVTCKRCGAPVFGNESKDGNCKHCEKYQFNFSRNVSLGEFDGKLKELIYQYKFCKRRCLAEVFTELFSKHCGGFITAHQILVPIPVTRGRLLERGFNQSEIIASLLSSKFGFDYFPGILKRKGNSIPQSETRTLNERINGLKDYFYIKPVSRSEIIGKSILLVDDVLTTGTTASMCAEALIKAGAGEVELLTIARSLRITA